ncbi:MAG: hypothetical protein AB7F86_02605 [Bdellovibrionales bacterium]
MDFIKITRTVLGTCFLLSGIVNCSPYSSFKNGSQIGENSTSADKPILQRATGHSTLSAAPGSLPLSMVFTGTVNLPGNARGGPASLNFGDGTSAWMRFPPCDRECPFVPFTHIYPAPGTYTATLTEYGPPAVGTWSVSIKVVVGAPQTQPITGCTLTFSVNPIKANQPTALTIKTNPAGISGYLVLPTGGRITGARDGDTIKFNEFVPNPYGGGSFLRANPGSYTFSGYNVTCSTNLTVN